MKYIVIFFAIACASVAQDFEKIASIDFEKARRKYSGRVEGVEFCDARNRAVGKCKCANAADFALFFAGDAAKKYDADNLFIVFEGESRIIVSLSESAEGASFFPPLIALGGGSSVGNVDSVVVNESGYGVDMEGLGAVIDNMVRRRIYLQIKNLDDNEKKFFALGSLLFPADVSTRRWTKNIKKMTIYAIQSEPKR